jgi:hypothetical protein
MAQDRLARSEAVIEGIVESPTKVSTLFNKISAKEGERALTSAKPALDAQPCIFSRYSTAPP